MSMISKAAAGGRSLGAGGGSAPRCARADHAQRPPHERPARRVVVGVDGSPNSAAAFQRAVSQARQRNAVLDVVCVLPPGADRAALTSAKVMLGEFTRHQCPYGAGTPMRLRVEQGDPQTVLLVVGAGAELLVRSRASAHSAAAGPGLAAPLPPGQVARPELAIDKYRR